MSSAGRPGFAPSRSTPTTTARTKQAEICAAADSVDTGDGVVVVTDMFGGSPSNLSLLACNPDNRQIVYGANLPMLIKLAKSRHLAVPEAVAGLAGRRAQVHRQFRRPQMSRGMTATVTPQPHDRQREGPACPRLGQVRRGGRGA